MPKGVYVRPSKLAHVFDTFGTPRYLPDSRRAWVCHLFQELLSDGHG